MKKCFILLSVRHNGRMEKDMHTYVGVTVILLIICMALISYIFLIRSQMREISRELGKTRKQDYNRQLTVQLYSKDLTELAAEINRNLDYQKHLKLEQAKQERLTKQSISDIAHDLRTPLTVVKGNLQLLEKRADLPEQGKECLRICQEKTEELKNMVDDFFELSVLESDREPVPLSKINITNLLMQFMIDNEVLIKEREICPQIELPEKTLWIMAEEQCLLRMLTNLLGNIIKYAEGKFRVILTEEEERCLIVFANPILADNGFEPEHLFERAYMGDASRNQKGNGLGLYIVKLLAGKQGADVSARKRGNELYIQISFQKG